MSLEIKSQPKKFAVLYLLAELAEQHAPSHTVLRVNTQYQIVAPTRGALFICHFRLFRPILLRIPIFTRLILPRAPIAALSLLPTPSLEYLVLITHEKNLCRSLQWL